MKKASQLSNLYRRARATLFILFVYMLGSFVPVPFAKITKQFTSTLHSTSTTIVGMLSGANFQRLSLFMIGLTPIMIAMLIIQLLTMTGLLGFDTLSMNQVNKVQQVLTLILAAIQSTALTLLLHLAVGIYQTISVILILTAGGMFVTWLGIMNMHFGIGGTVTLILFNIISESIPLIGQMIKQILKLKYAYLWIILLIIVSIAIVVFWVAFSRAYYPVKTINISMSSKTKPVVIPLGLNMGAMMMYMVGMALLIMPTLLAQLLGSKSIFADPRIDTLIVGIISFSLFYFFSFVQFSPHQKAKDFRDSNTYIPNIRPGKPTQRYLTKIMWWVCLPGAILNTIQLTIGVMGGIFLGKYANLTIIPLNIVMIVMIMGSVRDTLLTLSFPHKYEKLAEKEGRYSK